MMSAAPIRTRCGAHARAGADGFRTARNRRRCAEYSPRKSASFSGVSRSRALAPGSADSLRPRSSARSRKRRMPPGRWNPRRSKNRGSRTSAERLHASIASSERKRETGSRTSATRCASGSASRMSAIPAREHHVPARVSRARAGAPRPGARAASRPALKAAPHRGVASSQPRASVAAGQRAVVARCTAARPARARGARRARPGRARPRAAAARSRTARAVRTRRRNAACSRAPARRSCARRAQNVVPHFAPIRRSGSVVTKRRGHHGNRDRRQAAAGRVAVVLVPAPVLARGRR